MAQPWYNWGTSCVVRVNVTDYTLPIWNVRIVPRPFIPGGRGSVFTDIAYQRRSRFTTQRWYLDVFLNWDELSTNYSTFFDLVQDMANNVETNPILFSPLAPFDATKDWEVIPEFDDNMLGTMFDERIRTRDGGLVLRAKNTVSSLPTWLRD